MDQSVQMTKLSVQRTVEPMADLSPNFGEPQMHQGMQHAGMHHQGKQMCLPEQQKCFKQEWREVACPPPPCPPPCPPAQPVCPPKCEEPKSDNGCWGWLGQVLFWFIILTVLFWLIYYSLKPSWVLQSGTNQVDTAKVLLAAVVTAVILVIIGWIIWACACRK